MTEFQSRYLSDDEVDRFKRLVLKDLKGHATPEEDGLLNADLQLWSDELVLIIQDIQAQLAERKSAIQGRRVPPKDFQDYLTWKASAVKFQTKVLDKHRDVKSALRESNREDDLENGNSGVMRQILGELKAIHALLENGQT